MDYGIFSLLPIIVVLAIMIFAKNALISVLIGVLVCSIMILTCEGSWLSGLTAFTDVFASASNVMVIFFVMVVGGLLGLMRHSGGLFGLIGKLEQKKASTNSAVKAQLFVMLIGLLMFVDATSSVATTAIVGRPLFGKNKIGKERLALICNSTSSPIAWIIPFGGAGALIAGSLNNLDGITNGYEITLNAVIFQFYTLALLGVILFSVLAKKQFGKAKSDSEIEAQYKDDIDESHYGKARNMILPLIVLVGSIFALLCITGGGNIMLGDGSTSVFLGGLIAIAFSVLLFKFGKTASVSQSLQWCFSGMKDMLEVTVLLIVAFAFSGMIGDIGTANFLVSITSSMPIWLLPILALVISSVIAFCTGTSAGTVLLMIPLILPMVGDMTSFYPLVVGAIVSGAVFGDQNSIISDTVIMTSSMINIDAVDHFKTQLPYTSLALGLSAVVYLICGIIMA